MIQRFRLIDRWLRKSHGVTSYECRGVEKLRESLAAGHGIMLTPNHCRPSDPIVMGFPAREAKTHVYAMASWHLYNQDRFTAFAIRKMGGFSVNREGVDRKSLNTAIDVLESAERPLIVFPEGVTTRLNDRLLDFLDGVAFIARTAARRRAVEPVRSGRTVSGSGCLRRLGRDDRDSRRGIASAGRPIYRPVEDGRNADRIDRPRLERGTGRKPGNAGPGSISTVDRNLQPSKNGSGGLPAGVSQRDAGRSRRQLNQLTKTCKCLWLAGCW